MAPCAFVYILGSYAQTPPFCFLSLFHFPSIFGAHLSLIWCEWVCQPRLLGCLHQAVPISELCKSLSPVIFVKSCFGLNLLESVLELSCCVSIAVIEMVFLAVNWLLCLRTLGSVIPQMITSPMKGLSGSQV